MQLHGISHMLLLPVEKVHIDVLHIAEKGIIGNIAVKPIHNCGIRHGAKVLQERALPYPGCHGLVILPEALTKLLMERREEFRVNAPEEFLNGCLQKFTLHPGVCLR